MRRLLSAAVALAAFVAVPAAGAWTWPAEGPVLRPFSLGPDVYAAGRHRGVDIGAALGTDVVAPAAGTVTFAGFVPNGGRAVTIQTADGYSVTLLQLAAPSVLRGTVVAEGAVVGTVGASVDAVTTEPHVHLGVRITSDPDGYVDPLGLLPARLPAAVAVPPPLVVDPPPVEAAPPAEEPLPPVEEPAPVEPVQEAPSPAETVPAT